MGFKKDFLSLEELFPQHNKDVDAAVMAVLDEIVPFFIERRTPSSSLTSSFSVNGLSDVERQQSSGDADGGLIEPMYDAYGHHVEDKISEVTLSEKTHEHKVQMCADVYSPSVPVLLIDENRVERLQIESLGDPLPRETISGDKCSESSIKISSDGITHHKVGTQTPGMGISENPNLLQDNEGIAGHLQTDFGRGCNEESHVEKSSADGDNPIDETSLSTVVEPLESIAQLVEVPDMQKSNLDNSTACLSTDIACSEPMSNITGTEEESTLNLTMSQSSEIHIINVIEEIIADARNNKKTLFSRMKSIINLMKQVELKEQAAEHAKFEAAMGGMGILNKVEELKRMLEYAKEANDMHAGEVYGEKAILATELRELQSRVSSLSDERDKSLVVLDEMRQTLKVQLAAAENEIKSAKQEKLEKEKAAWKSFEDQELTMENVGQESKILKQQAEENAKLQEFLVDRGHVVDALQGEIVVICQDVRLLKEKFDQRVPFSRSLISSHTSFILASSNSSLRSLVLDQVQTMPLGDDNLSETQKNRDQATTRDDHKALQDEGWEFFVDAEMVE